VDNLNIIENGNKENKNSRFLIFRNGYYFYIFIKKEPPKL